VTNAKLANVASATFKGRATAGTGAPEDLTATQATALLDVATQGLPGLLSASDKTKLDGLGKVTSQIATAGGNVQDLAVGNAGWTLNGDTDGGWEIAGSINTPASSTGTTYYLQFNADTGANYKSTEIYYSGSQAPGGGDVNDGTINSGMVNAGVIMFEASVWTVSGKLRRYEIRALRRDLTSGAELAITNRGYYLATATVFDGTTRIHASAASGIQSGSWVSVTRKFNAYTFELHQMPRGRDPWFGALLTGRLVAVLPRSREEGRRVDQ
jgi:hypothetical protein